MKIPSMGMKTERFHVDFRGLELQCFWYPAESLDRSGCEELSSAVNFINRGRGSVSYGFFDPEWSSSRRESFLARSSWCIVYRDNSPCGFACNYDLGDVSSVRVIHQGLVKFNLRMGSEHLLLIYLCLAWGNIKNWGGFVATSVSHVPLIISLFEENMIDVYPRLDGESLQMPPLYQDAYRLLVEEYISPVLGHAPDSVVLDKLRIQGSLAENNHGFETRWRVLPKSGSQERDKKIATLLGVKSTDRFMRVENDVIQIGLCEGQVLTRGRNRFLLQEAGLPLD